MSKKILAALLAVMMVLSLVPMTALAAEEPDVIRAPLGDTTDKYPSNLLNIDGYEVAYEEDSTITEEGVTAYKVAVTHPALLKHSNNANPQVSGLWVGIGVKITTPGEGEAKDGTGSSYYAFVTDKTVFSEIAQSFKEKDWAGPSVAGYSEYGWRAHENGYVFQWYNLADTTKYEGKTPYLVERNPQEDGGYTYKAYKGKPLQLLLLLVLL